MKYPSFLKLKINDTLFLSIALITFVVLIAQAIYKSSVQENFQENFQDNSCRQAPQLDWWDENPVRSIISRSYGTSLDVLASTPSANLDSNYIIPIKNPNNNNPVGCITINLNGTYTISLCDLGNGNQHWNIVKVNDEDAFREIIGNDTSVNESENYPFFMILSVADRTRALSYSRGSISVRPVGNYEDQKWLVSQEQSGSLTPVIEYNQHMGLSPEYVNRVDSVDSGDTSSVSIPSINNQNIVSKLDQILEVLGEKVNAPSSGFGEKDTGTGPIQLNINFAQDPINSSPNNNPQANLVPETFQNINSNTNSPNTNSPNTNSPNTNSPNTDLLLNEDNIPSCPTQNLDDFVSTTGIPCNACGNF